MKKLFVFFLIMSSAFAAEKKLPQGQADNDVVTITAMIIPPEQVKQEFGTHLDGNFTVLEVHVSPKAGKPYDVQLDDFVLRSESDGDHSGPLVAGQIAGAGELVVKHTYAGKSSPGNPALLTGTSVELKDAPAQDAVLDALKKKILAEKVTGDPVSGLLFFPLEKEKPKNLILSCTTPKGKLRLQFK